MLHPSRFIWNLLARKRFWVHILASVLILTPTVLGQFSPILSYSAQAQSDPTEFVNFRGSIRQGFARMVIEWPRRFEYGIEASGNLVTILFSNPSDGNFSNTVSLLSDYIADMRRSSDGLAYTIFLKNPMRLNTFTSNNTLVLDIIEQQPDQQLTNYSAGVLSVSDWLRLTGQSGQQAVTEIAIDDPDVVFRRGIDSDTFTPGIVTLPDRDSQQTIEEEQAQQDRAAANFFAPLNREDLPPILSSYSFPFSQPVGAALFRRGEYLWLVFDRFQSVPISQFLQQSRLTVQNAEQMPVSDITVLRMSVDPAFNPILRRGNNGTDWIMDFMRMPLRPLRNIEITVDIGNITLGPQIIFSVPQPSRVVQVADPDLGDIIDVMLVLEPGIGVREERRYPEFSILASNQGGAVVTLKPTSVVNTSLDAFVLSDPTGLYVSGVTPSQTISSRQSQQKFASRLLFDFSRWQLDPSLPYLDRERELMLNASSRPPGERTIQRLQLARFYAANGLGHELLGILKTLNNSELSGVVNPIALSAEFIGLSGVGNFLAGRMRQARSNFFDPRLDDIQEVALWRGMVEAREGRWGSAELRFRHTETIWRDYPERLLVMIGILRLETALALRDVELAESLLPLLSEKDVLSDRQHNALSYQQGRIALSKNDVEQAIQLWADLAKQAVSDPLNSARAEYALVSLNRRQFNSTDDEVLSHLERLQYRWRGDRFQLNVLNQLSEIYLQRNRYRDALYIMRQAVTSFPEDPLAITLQQRMSQIFLDLFFAGKADEISPLRALALFDEFRELTPPTERGNRMVERLVNRLVDVDLLEQAAKLLSYQVDYRLDGVEKARVGMKLAIVQLIDNKPRLALDALNASAYVQIPRDLEDDRRRVRAKAEYELGNVRESTLLIAGDLSSDADLLRQDIYWEQGNWIEVSKVMQRLAGPPPDSGESITNSSARIVLYWVVALKLQNNSIDLDAVVRNYGEFVRRSPYGPVFSFIVDTPTPADGTDLRSFVREVASKAQFDSFIENYRTRLKDEI